jgi:hypothetical protein
MRFKYNLDYDETEFYYFEVTLLIIMLPTTWQFLIYPLLFGDMKYNCLFKK